MKFLRLLKGELRASLKRFPVIILFIALCLGAVVTALPMHMLQRGESVDSLKIAVSTPEHDSVFEQVLAFIRLEKRVAEIDLVAHDEALALVKDKQVDFYLEFPENFEEALFEREEASIKLRASNPMLGAVAYQILDGAISSLNQMQGSSLLFYNALKETEHTRKERNELSEAFDLQLIRLAIFRGNYIKMKSGISQYQLQALALILFLSTSIVVCYYAIVISIQEKNQVFRKLLLYKYSLTQIWLSKLSVCLLLTIPITGFMVWTAGTFEMTLNVPYLFFGALFLMTLLYSLVILVSAVSTVLGWNRNISNVLLVSFIILFVAMLLGGLVYPSYSQSFRATAGNPAWLAQLLADSAISGVWLDMSVLPIYCVMIFISYLLTMRYWRRSL